MRLFLSPCLALLVGSAWASGPVAAQVPRDGAGLLQEIQASLSELGEHLGVLEGMCSRCSEAWSLGRKAGWAPEPEGMSAKAESLAWLKAAQGYVIPGRGDRSAIDVEEAARYALLSEADLPPEGIKLLARCKDLSFLLEQVKSKYSIAKSKLEAYASWRKGLGAISIEAPGAGTESWTGELRARVGFCTAVDVYLLGGHVQPALSGESVEGGVYAGFLVPERKVWQGLAVLGKDARGRVVGASELVWVRGTSEPWIPPKAEEVREEQSEEEPGEILKSDGRIRGTEKIPEVIPPGYEKLSPTMAVHEGDGYVWAPEGEKRKKLYPWRILHKETGIVLLLVKEGEFWMGSPEDEEGRSDNELRHRVRITRPFYLADTEVTQSQWEKVMGENPSWFKQGGNYPVERVSWDAIRGDVNGAPDPKSFCGRTGLELPTEAQWEYACRAGTTTAIYTGKLKILGKYNAPDLDPIAWYGGNSGVDYDGYDSSDRPEKQYPHEKAGTHPVGQKRPNAWGFYDMLGNVWEWCRDWYGDYRGHVFEDPEGPSEGSYRVRRGGGWGSGACRCRSANRGGVIPSYEWFDFGFRPSRSLP